MGEVYKLNEKSNYSALESSNVRLCVCVCVRVTVKWHGKAEI